MAIGGVNEDKARGSKLAGFGKPAKSQRKASNQAFPASLSRKSACLSRFRHIFSPDVTSR